MNDLIDVALLADLKKIPVEILARFGLRDIPGGGVRIDYATPEGTVGRARNRWQASGLTGSTFEEGDSPITAYWWPENRELVRARDAVLLAEGESTCWTLWYLGFAAVGFPGADKVDSLEAGHLEGTATAIIVAERDDPDTYPDGVAEFVTRVASRLRGCGFDGTLKVLDMAPIAEDVNALYRANPAEFERTFKNLINTAPER